MTDRPPIPRDRRSDATIATAGRRRRCNGLLLELVVFGLKQARASVFAGTFLLLLILSSQLSLAGLHRYDLLFLGAIVIQLMLVFGRLESPREVAVLALFHALGMGLELFKTSAVRHAISRFIFACNLL
jgi:uncharacterized membrane protein YoaT (DUF817 family)